MRKYFFLLLPILAGFTSTDVQKEIYTIDWQVSENPENTLGYTFSDAEYFERIRICRFLNYSVGKSKS